MFRKINEKNGEENENIDLHIQKNITKADCIEIEI